MSIVADLHIHSKYSRAVSPRMDLAGIAGWASKKGINLVATGDWTHPLWFRSLQKELMETEQGIYRLRTTPAGQMHPVRFLLATELSSIYSQGGKGRRIHLVVLAPSLEVVAKINAELIRRGANLASDGRPILGLSEMAVQELVLSIDERCLIVPAHIWTPWFSLFGSKSGFDSIAECFGETGAKHIYAIETGLSSDPIMNWQIRELETRTILSSSDAHSGPKLGREATVFVPNPKSSTQKTIASFTYDDIIDAIKQKNSPLSVGYTIEFFPEEGKYHWSGHRACNVRYTPQEIREKGIVCPVCKSPLTVGVENRVLDLARRTIVPADLVMAQNSAGLTYVDDKEKKRKPFVSIIPLLEILLEIHGNSPTKANAAYDDLVTNVGTEFDILLRMPLNEIEQKKDYVLRRAIEIVRSRTAYVDPGYDGVFGVVKIFKDEAAKTKPAKKEPVQATLI